MMSNRVMKAVCAAWLGMSLAACGSTQDEAAQALQAKDTDIRSAMARFEQARVVANTDEGVPYYIEGRLGELPRLSEQRARQDGEAARAALTDIAPAFRLNNTDLVFRKSSVDSQ